MSYEDLAKQVLTLGGSLRATMVVIFAICIVLLWAPLLTGGLGLQTLVDAHRPWVGGALLVSGAFSAVHLLRACHTAMKGRRAMKIQEKRLRSLGIDEQEALLEFVLGGQKTVRMSMAHGVAGSLEAQGIVFRSSNLGDLHSGFAYSMQPWAWEYLFENPECLGLPADQSKWAEFAAQFQANKQQRSHHLRQW